MQLVSRIVSQLPKLKELSLPSLMKNAKEERRLSNVLTDNFWNESKIRLKFVICRSHSECIFQNPTKQAYESSDDEDSSSSEDSSDPGVFPRSLTDDREDDWDEMSVSLIPLDEVSQVQFKIISIIFK